MGILLTIGRIRNSIGIKYPTAAHFQQRKEIEINVNVFVFAKSFRVWPLKMAELLMFVTSGTFWNVDQIKNRNDADGLVGMAHVNLNLSRSLP